MFTTTKGRLLSGVGLLVAASIVLGVAVAPNQYDDSAQETQAAETVRIGTFDPQAALQQYHRVSELIALEQQLEPEAMRAVEAGDQQRLMELQMQMQQAQMQIIEAFQAELDQAMPDVAREANVQIVAVQVVYSDPSIEEAQDLTQQVVEKINADAPQDDQPLDEQRQPEPNEDNVPQEPTP